MQKIKIIKINYGSLIHERKVVEELKKFDGAEIELTKTFCSIKTISGQQHSYTIEKSEEDFASITFVGCFESGIKFRLVRSSEMILKILESQEENDGISLGSMQPNGYAVHFEFE